MSLRLSLRYVSCESGERFPMLVNAMDGNPLFLPCAYISSVVRGRNNQCATQEAHLKAIKFLYCWSEKHGIDIEKRFAAGDFLELPEIDNLTAEAWTRADKLVPASAGNRVGAHCQAHRVPSIERVRLNSGHTSLTSVSANTAGIRLRYIRGYLGWLSSRQVAIIPKKERASIVNDRKEMLRQIAIRIPPSEDTLNKRVGIEDKAEERLLTVINPQSTENPWLDMRVRRRNELYIIMLLALGIRKGEALGIRVSDIDFHKQTVTIHRTPDDPTDSRKHKPQSKTLPRELWMNKMLCNLLWEYVMKTRRKNLPEAKRNHFLFVETKHGKPMSLSTAVTGNAIMYQKLQ